MKSLMPKQTKAAAWTPEHVWCASYLHSTAGDDEAGRLKAATKIIRSYYGADDITEDAKM